MNFNLNCVSAFSEPRDKFLTEKVKQNEDSLLTPVKKANGFLFGVADGLGSYKGAREASNFVCDYLQNHQTISHNYLENSFNLELKTAFNNFIDKINGDYVKASTTLSLCFLDDFGLSIWHVGDCRVYIKQGTKLIQITNDHTQYQKLLDKKIYSKKELIDKKISQSTLTNAISSFISLDNDYIFISYDSLKAEYGSDLSIFIMSDGAHHFWEQRKMFSKFTMSDVIKFSNALKRRIENKGAIDDYTSIGVTFNLIF
ncbi:MAG: protein phosphatase 2C domain-containing protein [Gammaproteobacteria bacterium]|nr:protein phosphatase 2C domain-containing protein [Gammaproteobacteria bacterium]